MKTPAFDQLVAALCAGRKWEGMGDGDRARKLLEDVYLERYGKRHWDSYMVRATSRLSQSCSASMTLRSAADAKLPMISSPGRAIGTYVAAPHFDTGVS